MVAANDLMSREISYRRLGHGGCHRGSWEGGGSVAAGGGVGAMGFSGEVMVEEAPNCEGGEIEIGGRLGLRKLVC